jgi:glycosyltransferase involved in cell wall biosynthesis
LPAFNAAATVAAALRSVQRQTERRWECLVADDGSTDETAAIARTYASEDARFTVLSRPHRGLVAALNAGIERCRGDFVARMDADDLMHRERLAEQARALSAAPDLAAVGCHVRMFPRSKAEGARSESQRPRHDGLRAYERWLNGIDSAARVCTEAFVECPIAHPTLMIRREIVSTFGYRDCGWPEDYDLILRLLAAGHPIGMVPRRLLAWRHEPRRLSRTHPYYAIDRFTACKAAFLARGFLADHDTYILWGYGATGRALHRALAPYGKRLSHLVDVAPGRLGNVIHGAPVISPEQLAGVRRRPVVISVAGERPRQQIRTAMTNMGFHELQDFICAA